jgi:DNA-binding transcriptional LysR family regulator
MNVTLRQLRALVLVGQLGSFTRAAQAMHLSQSALSMLVRELEASMGARLVDRTTRSVSLTVAGSELVAGTQQVLADLERAIGRVDELVAKQRGRVVLAAPLVLSSALLPPALAAFRRAYPGIELVLHDTLPSQVLPQVRSGAADLGIGSFSPAEADLQRRLLFREAMVAAYAPGHPFRRRRRLGWGDLSGQPLLVMRPGSVFRDLTEGGLQAAGVPLDPAFEADFVGSLVGLAGAGVGVAIVPGYAMALTDPGRVHWQRLDGPLVEREVLLVHRAGRSLSPAAQALVEVLVATGLPQLARHAWRGGTPTRALRAGRVGPA